MKLFISALVLFISLGLTHAQPAYGSDCEIVTFPQQEKTEKETIRVNFQPANEKIPDNYIADVGQAFKKQRSDHYFGWSENVSNGARNRKSFRTPDFRLNTFLHIWSEELGIDANWEIALENGEYLVTIGVGDPTYTGELYSLKVENTTFSFTNSPYMPTKKVTKHVSVSDGRLTIARALTSNQTSFAKIGFVDIEPITNDRTVIAPPTNIVCKQLPDQTWVEVKDQPAHSIGTLIIYADNIDSADEKSRAALLDKYEYLDLHQADHALLDMPRDSSSFYVFSYDGLGNLSTPSKVVLKNKVSSDYLEKKQFAIELMESLDWDDSPTTINSAFNLFANNLFHQEHVKNTTPEVVDRSLSIHESVNSVNINVSTSAPTKLKLEVSSEQSFKHTMKPAIDKRYFYNHIFHVNQLISGQLYYYRLVDTSQNKPHIIHEGQFSTLEAKNIKWINDLSSLPIRLTQDNTKYVLKPNVLPEAISSRVFEIVGDNIELDLNGELIRVVTDAVEYPGIISTSKNAQRKVAIVNGKIEFKGNNCTDTRMDSFCHVVSLKNAQRVKVKGLDITYEAASVRGLVVEAQDSAFSSYYASITHNRFHDKHHKVLNRHGSGGTSAIQFVSNVANMNSTFDVSFNLISRTRQNGIQFANLIHRNEVYVDSWSTNSFAIQPRAEGLPVTNNKVFLTGYHAIAFAWSTSNMTYENNYIEMQGINSHRNRWWEGFGDQNSLNGFRITNYAPGGQVRQNHKYIGNKIKGVARNGSQMRGLQLWTDSSITGTEFKYGTVEIISEDINTTQVAPVVIQGTGGIQDHAVSLYKNSILRSNLTFVRFGDYYGRGQNALFQNIIFEKISGHPEFHSFVFDGGYKNGGHTIKNSTFLYGAEYGDILWKRTSKDSNLRYKVEIPVELPTGASVTIIDANKKMEEISIESETQSIVISDYYFSRAPNASKTNSLSKRFNFDFPLNMSISHEQQQYHLKFATPAELPEKLSLEALN